ncbi:hypothetical protein A1O7_01730 [Cladophialophora yegresii CBS 114405]|uniref:Uncharacterized protein n=1 Tax=Cladophialophora yegresii CBS 114405 TaxID=1182544 RepID=W9X4L9_9EURO|nr:uncharacterized protein A1O7_01730 [Cladophialophora yegresii CBS 114405]EXJ65389.1 hypothetical protein A1O7_01730 [Cladophialophora yegresii CBS 114405]
MEMEDVASAENRKPRTSKTEARGPANPVNTSRSLPGSSQALNLGFIIKPTREASPPKISEAASQRPEKQVSDVPIRRPAEKELRGISKLESDNRELRDELQKLQDRLSSVQSTNARDHDTGLAAGLADSANKIAKLEDALANEKSQAADKISALTREVAKIAQLQNVISGLETKWTNSQRDLLQAQRDKRTLSDQIAQKDQSIAYFNNKYNQEKEAKEKQMCDFSRQHQSLATSCANKDKTIKQQKLDIVALRKEAEHHHEGFKKAAAENEKLRAHIEQQEMSVTKAQNAAMSVLARSLSAALPDDRIRTKFKELFESIAEWARDNATEDRTILDDTDSKLKWQKYGIFRWVAELGAQPNLEFDFGDETAIDTLLNTALARRFCQDFLRNPFWFAEDSSPITNVNLPKAERIDTDLAMGRLLKKMMSYHEGHEAGVHAWRAATVETLAGSPYAREKIQNAYKKYMEEELLDFCKDFVRSGLDEVAKGDLLSIVAAFGDFAIEIWSQKYDVQYFCLNSFERDVYKVSDERMELARAVGVEEGDVSLDGRPIPCVVQPLILGYGTSDGKNYDRKRVWSKAVVWVSKDGKSEASQAAKSRFQTSWWYGGGSFV